MTEGSDDVVSASEAPKATNDVEAEVPSRSTGRRTIGPSMNTVKPCIASLSHT